MKIFVRIIQIAVIACLASCSKDEDIATTEPPVKAASMLEKHGPALAGKRTWTVRKYVNIPANRIDTVYFLPNDTFSIEKPSLDILIFKEFNLTYTNLYFTGEFIDTTKFIYYASFLFPQNNQTLKYYYASDSIVAAISSGGLGGSIYTVYTSNQ